MFSERLKTLRIEKGLTQSQLAQELGISNKTVSVYEKGTSLPTFDTLAKIASYFDTTTDFLIGYSDKRNPKIEKIADELNLSPNAVKAILSLTQDDVEIISPLFENSNFRDFLTYATVYALYPILEANNMTPDVFDDLPNDLLNLSPEDKRALVNTALKSTALKSLEKSLDEISVRVKSPTSE